MRLAFFALLIAVTTSASAQWEIEESHTTASLRGIHNVGGGVAWASGTNGTVLRTIDDGKTWHTCPIPLAGTKDTAEKLDFRGIQAFDENTAIVMSSGTGDLSRLYKTTDGCQTWTLLFTNPDKDGFWDAFSFDSRHNGWLLGDPTEGSFTLFYTSDFGNRWSKQYDSGLRAEAQSQGAFAASNSSLLRKYGMTLFASGGTAGAFLYTRTNSASCLNNCRGTDEPNSAWERQPITIGNRTEGAGIFSVAAEPPALAVSIQPCRKLVAVGGDYKLPDASGATSASSLDCGRTWIAAQTPPHGYRSAVAYDPSTKNWITVGPNGTDISTDDGRNWHPLTPTPQDAPEADKNWNALSLPFVVGPKGRIGKLRPTALSTPLAAPGPNAKVRSKP